MPTRAERGAGRPAGVAAPARRRWASARGQSTVMVLSMLFFLVLFVGVTANVGQAVNRRVALQVAADAGAWTGASTMATGLNNMAFWNRRLQELWTALSIATLGFTISPSCEVADAIFLTYRTGHSVLDFALTLTNAGFGLAAHDEARRVTRQNIQDLFPGELPVFDADGTSFQESDLSPEVGIAPQRSPAELVSVVQVPDGTMPPGLPALSPSRRRVTYLCIGGTPPLPQVRSQEVDVWYQRADTTPVSFVWIVKAPAARAFVFDDVFGPNTLPEMRAAAAARPVGGSIAEGKSDYIVTMVPLEHVSAGTILDRFFFRGARPLLH